MQPNRLSEMLTYIAQHHKVALTDLCEQFGISMSTLRRDIKLLHNEGLIEKQYGFVSDVKKAPGERSVSSLSLALPYHERSFINTAEKAITARLAAQLIENDDVIFIDSGSTTALIVEYLQHLKHVTIITNNLDVVVRSRPYTQLDVYVLPGLYKRNNNSFSLLTESYIYDYYNIKKAFLACTGLTVADGVSHMDLSERVIKNYTIGHTKKCCLLADHSKFGFTAPLHLCNLDAFSVICTDRKPDMEYIDYCIQHNITLYYDSEQDIPGESKQI